MATSWNVKMQLTIIIFLNSTGHKIRISLGLGQKNPTISKDSSTHENNNLSAKIVKIGLKTEEKIMIKPFFWLCLNFLLFFVLKILLDGHQNILQ